MALRVANVCESFRSPTFRVGPSFVHLSDIHFGQEKGGPRGGSRRCA
jgi:hypothetical protein